MNRPLTIKEWFESLGKMVEEFDWKGNGMSEQGKGWTLRSCCLPLQSPSQTAPVEQTICLNPIHNETICSQNQDSYTHRQKPVAWRLTNSSTGQIELDWDCEGWSKDFDIRTPLYTHPKEWVGLTDEEIETIRTTGNIWTAYDISKAVEAKLREKNT